MVFAAREREAITPRPIRQRAHQTLAQGGTDEFSQAGDGFGALRVADAAQAEAHGIKATQLIEVAQAEWPLGRDDHVTAAYLKHAELAARRIAGAHLIGQDGLKATATAEADAQRVIAIQDGVDANRRRAFATGDVGAHLLLGERQTDGPGPDGLQGLFPGDLFQSRARLPLLAVDRARLQDGQNFLLGFDVLAQLRDGRHGVATDLLLGILEETLEPRLDLELQGRVAAMGENDPDGPNQGHLPGTFLARGLVELGNLDAPKLPRRQFPELSVEVVIGFHDMRCRAGPRQCQGRRTEPAPTGLRAFLSKPNNFGPDRCSFFLGNHQFRTRPRSPWLITTPPTGFGGNYAR